MRNVADIFRPIRLWQVLVLIGTLVGSGMGSYTLTNSSTSSSTLALASNQQLISVQRGDLINSVEINGSVLFPERERLNFKVAGTVGEVMVEEGQEIEKGDPLAKFDTATIAKLEKEIAQKRVSLQSAKDSLEKARVPFSAKELAAAMADVSKSKVEVDTAEETLAETRGYTDSQLRDLEQLVALAEVNVQKAKDALDNALDPFTEHELAKQRESVKQAQVQLQSATDALATAKTPYTEQELAKQRESIKQAQVQLQSATDALATAKSPYTTQQITAQRQTVATAEKSVEDAKEVLVSVQTPYTTAEIASSKAAVSRAQETLLNNQDSLTVVDGQQERLVADVLQIQTDRQLEYRQALLAKYGLPVALIPDSDIFLAPASILAIYPARSAANTSDPQTAWDDLILSQDNLRSAENVQAKALTAARKAVTTAEDSLTAANETLSIRQSGGNKVEIALREVNVEKAEADLTTANDKLSEMIAEGDFKDIALREAQIATAEANLTAAEQTLTDMLAGGDLETIALREAQIATTKASLAEAEQTLTDMLAEPDVLDIALKKAQLAKTRADLITEKEELATLLSEPDPSTISLKEDQLRLANESLTESREHLAELTAGADPLTVSLRSKELATAESDLAVAIENLANSVLISPIPGVVEVTNVEVGDQIGPAATAFEVVNTQIAEIDGRVDEIDILFVRVGAQAPVTMDALQGQTLTGEVAWISTTATTNAGAVSFSIRIRVEAPEGVELREGLSAVASIVLRESKDVLLVPSAAVGGSFLQPTINIVEGGEIVERPVTLGDSDDFFVVVQQGIQEGDQVMVESEGSSATQFNLGTGGARALRQIFTGGSRPPTGTRGGQGSGGGAR